MDIAEVLRIAGENNQQRHTLFWYLVLRQPLLDAIIAGHAFRDRSLSEQDARFIAERWHEPQIAS